MNSKPSEMNSETNSETIVPAAAHTFRSPDEESNSVISNEFLEDAVEREFGKNEKKTIPWFAYPLLVAATLAVSSAAVAFEALGNVPPITAAAWRLQATSILLLFGFIPQYLKLSKTDQTRFRKSFPLLASSGVCLALHFALWFWGLQHTSLTHSLLFISVSPVLIALIMWITCKPISKGEILGTGLAVLGALVLSGGGFAEPGSKVGLFGDLATLAGAVAVTGYLLAGSNARKWMPIFVYAFPVTLLGAILQSIAGFVLEEHSFVEPRKGVFGWLTSTKVLPLIVYLACGPGIVGHTGFNTVLRYFPPLVIALATTLEPVLGSLLGWALGFTSFPSLYTILGGAMLITATIIVTIHSHKREQAIKDKEAAKTAIEMAFGDPNVDDDMRKLLGNMD